MTDVKQYNRYHILKELMLNTHKDIGFIKKKKGTTSLLIKD